MECGLGAFFSSENLCDAERDEDTEVTVRKYENVVGRSRGAQMEIVEFKMNGNDRSFNTMCFVGHTSRVERNLELSRQADMCQHLTKRYLESHEGLLRSP
jgi:hypothetical protein